jgi:hypothetical protein
VRVFSTDVCMLFLHGPTSRISPLYAQLWFQSIQSSLQSNALAERKNRFGPNVNNSLLYLGTGFAEQYIFYFTYIQTLMNVQLDMAIKKNSVHHPNNSDEKVFDALFSTCM